MFQSTQFLHQLIQQSTSCIFVTDKDARLTMVSPPARQYFIDSPYRIEGQPVEECVSNACLLKTLQNAETALSEGQISFHELTPWGENREQFGLRFQGNKVVENDGTFLGCIYTFAIEKPSNRQEFETIMLKNLMKNSDDLIYFKDLESKFTGVSDSMVDRIGVDSV
ncbi:hypothetical protein N9L06_05835, partial [Mariniblastus sp.]|nr:hypothetical protein [Mariniblastus sp.]